MVYYIGNIYSSICSVHKQAYTNTTTLPLVHVLMERVNVISANKTHEETTVKCVCSLPMEMPVKVCIVVVVVVVVDGKYTVTYDIVSSTYHKQVVVAHSVYPASITSNVMRMCARMCVSTILPLQPPLPLPPLPPASGCTACDCNQHSNTAKGVCDIHNGTCHCLDNTTGRRCDTCEPGYHGDPRLLGT